MRKKPFKLAFILLALWAAGQAGPPADGDDVTAMTSLVKDLASANYATREAAQKALLATPMEQLAQLRQVAGTVTDPEAVLRLRTILGALDTIDATTTPAISMDVHNATFSEVGDALAKATGAAVDGDAQISRDRFTLHVVDQPFWEIIEQLSAQHPISLADRHGLTIKPPSAVSSRHRQYIRGVLLSMSEPMVDGRFGPLGGGNLSVNVVVALDPRIKPYQAWAPALLGAKDNLGHTFAGNEDQERRRIINPTHLWDGDLEISAPQGMGDKMSIRGSASFTVVTQERSVEIVDPLKHLDEAIPVGDLTFTLRQFIHSRMDEANEGGTGAMGVKFEVIPGNDGRKAPVVGDMTLVGAVIHVPSFGRRAMFPIKAHATGAAEINNNDVAIADGTVQFDTAAEETTAGISPLEWTMLDADGKELLSARLEIAGPSTIVRAAQGDFGDPKRLIVKTGRRTEVTLPFEFKDMPVKK